jgi:hypothetical protein
MRTPVHRSTWDGREALTSVGGFTPGLRLGEDVDLLWRMQALGWRAFYLPAGAVHHEYRDRLGPFLRRKAQYARSEAWLRRRHPVHYAGKARHAPDIALALLAAGILAGGRLWMGGLVAATGLLLAETAWQGWRRRDAARDWPAWMRVAALARRGLAGLLARCRAIVRNHAVLGLPLLALGAWRPAWLGEMAGILLAGAVGEALARRPGLPPLRFFAGYAMDALAYSFGRWVGEAAARPRRA